MKYLTKGYEAADLTTRVEWIPIGLQIWSDTLADVYGEEYLVLFQRAASMLFLHPDDEGVMWDRGFNRLAFHPDTLYVACVPGAGEAVLYRYLQTYSFNTNWIWNEVMGYLGARTYPEIQVPTGSMVKSLLRNPSVWTSALWWEDNHTYVVLCVDLGRVFKMTYNVRTGACDYLVQ